MPIPILGMHWGLPSQRGVRATLVALGAIGLLLLPVTAQAQSGPEESRTSAPTSGAAAAGTGITSAMRARMLATIQRLIQALRSRIDRNAEYRNLTAAQKIRLLVRSLILLGFPIDPLAVRPGTTLGELARLALISVPADRISTLLDRATSLVTGEPGEDAALARAAAPAATPPADEGGTEEGGTEEGDTGEAEEELPLESFFTSGPAASDPSFTVPIPDTF